MDVGKVTEDEVKEGFVLINKAIHSVNGYIKYLRSNK